MTNKKKINLEKIVNEEEILLGKIQEDLEGNKIYFLKKDEKDYYPDASEIDVFGRKLYVLMKEEFRGALFDPSSDDLETLRKSRNYSKGELKQLFSKTKLNPEMCNFIRTIDDKYISSLTMNIIKYPADIPFKENLKEMGFENPEIKKYYAQATAAWLGQPSDLDLKGMTSKLDKITSWSGSSDAVDLSVENCEKGSHYVLKADVKKKQQKAQKDAVIHENYSSIETKIADYIRANSTNEKITNNTENLIRMFLNLSCLYDKNKPLPLK